MKTVVEACLVGLILVPGALAVSDRVPPVILVGCFDGQTYPPVYMRNYTLELATLARQYVSARYGDGIQVVAIGEWSFLLDALGFPNVIGGLVSFNVREGGKLFLSELRVREMMSSFEKGLGLLGLHGLGYAPYSGILAREVFPLDANLSAPGKISRVPVTTMRHTHEKASNHEITDQLPDQFDAPDGILLYRPPLAEGEWWTPQVGKMTVLYVCKSVGRYEAVPSVVAYERGAGRSVSFAGLRHTDGLGKYEKDPNWYNHSLQMPTIRALLGESLLWTIKPLAEANSLEARIEASSAFFAEKLAVLTQKKRMAEEGKGRMRNEARVRALAVLVGSALMVVVIGYVGFFRDDTPE